jgi:hypothetical protein
MAAAAAAIAEARAREADHRRHLGAALDMALVMRLHGVAPDRMRPEMLTRHELNRLRHRELAAEDGRAPAAAAAADDAAPDAWLAASTAVLTDCDGTRRDGAIMPVAFWYETFMPRLLRCASIRSDADLAALEAEGEDALDAWHAGTAQSGAFDRYAADLRDGFAAYPLPVKRALKRAWRNSRTSRSSAFTRATPMARASAPGTAARSVSRTHRRGVSAMQPIFGAIDGNAAHWLPCSAA